MKIFNSIIILSYYSILIGMQNPTIMNSQEGLLVLEFNIDSVWVEQNQIYSSPKVPNNITPGSIKFPCFQTPLTGIPKNATIKVFRSLPKTLKKWKKIYNTIERSSDGESISNYHNSTIHQFNPGDVLLFSNQSIKSSDISVLKTSIIDNISSDWVWYSKTTVQISWDHQSKGDLLIDNLNKNKTNSSLGENYYLEPPAYMTNSNLIRISVDSSGYYRIPLDSILDKEPNISSINHNYFKLWSKNQEIMMYYHNELGFIFYGEKAKPPDNAPYQNNFYTSTNYYWLTWGDEAGLRYAEESVYPILPENEVEIPLNYTYKINFEKDQYFARLGTINTHEQWDSFDHYFINPPINGGKSENFLMPIIHPYSSSIDQYSFKAEIQGMTTNNHNLTLIMNQNVLGSIAWSGQSLILFETDDTQIFPNNELIHGDNILTLTLGGGNELDQYNQIYLNWMEVTYSRKFNAYKNRITFQRDGDYSSNTQFVLKGFTSPDIILFKKGQSRLRDFILENDNGYWNLILQDQILGSSLKYHAIHSDSIAIPRNINSMDILNNIHSHQSNYIIIAPDSFKTTISPLEQLHDAVVISPESIYRYYNDGVLSPYAIRDFLTDAYINWSISPEYLLIAQQGMYTGNIDGFKFSGHYIPAMRIQTEGYGAVSSDFWYTLLTGNDYIPELSIGRLPASSNEELSNMVNKIILSHDSQDMIWENSILMIGGYETEFKEQSESLINRITQQGYFPNRIYIDQYSDDNIFWGTTDSVINQMERGVSFINYLGHGGGAVWGDRSLFGLDDLDNLNNNHKLPFITSMTCHTGNVTNPNSLGRKMLNKQTGGASGWFGSSGIAWIINDYLLLQPIINRLFSDESMTIGQLINEAKMEYLFTNTTYPDIAISQIFQFNLIGDPGLYYLTYPTTHLDIEDQSLSLGTDISLNLNYQSIDSLRIQWLDSNSFPITKPYFIDDDNSTLPDLNQSGAISLQGAYKNNNILNQFTIPFTIEEPFIELIEIAPQYPVFGDSITIKVFVNDPNGVQTVECWTNDTLHSNMIIDNTSIYILEKKIPSPETNGNSNFKIKVINNLNNTTWSNEFNINALEEFFTVPLSLDILNGNRVGIMGSLKNNSQIPGKAKIDLTVNWENTDEEITLFSDSLYFSALEFVTKEFNLPLKSGTHQFNLYVTSPRKYKADTLIALNTTLTINKFWATPDLGTTENLLSNDTLMFHNLSFLIAPNVVNKNEVLSFSIGENITVIDQPSLNYVQINENIQAIEIMINNNINWNGIWSIGQKVGPDTTIFSYSKNDQIWYPVDGFWIDSLSYQFYGNGPTILGWFTSNDVTGPVLEATINGQLLLTNSYLNKNPEIIILANDESGIDLESDKTVFLKNNLLWEVQNDLTSNGIGKLKTINLNPSLSVMDTSIGIILADKLDNISDTLILKFKISENLELYDYGNFPNPFKDQTRFAYELTENVDEFSLTIFTVDGRTIRKFDSSSSVSEIDLDFGGFHEIIWDGKDEWGDFVGNGVYFYRMRVQSNDNEIISIGKIGKTR